jgi:hypothetical protein
MNRTLRKTAVGICAALVLLLALSSCPGIIIVIPVPPSNLTGQVSSSTAILLSWIDNSDNEEGFSIEWSSTPGAFSNTRTVGAGTTTTILAGLAAETTYYARLCAYNSAGESGYTNIIMLVTGIGAPIAPTSIVTTVLSSSSVRVAWTDNSDNEDGFDIFRSIDSLDTADFVHVISAAADATEFVDTGLPPAKNIFYFVSAFTGDELSDPTDLACAVTDSISALQVPANLVASNGTEAYEILLSWTWSEGAVSYRVYGSDSSAGMFLLLGETTREIAYIKADDTVHYFYKVTAVDSGGNETNRSGADEGWALNPTIIFSDDFEEEFSGWFGSPDNATFMSHYDTAVFWSGLGANGTTGSYRLDGGYLNSISESVYTYAWLDSVSHSAFQPNCVEVYVRAASTIEEGAEIRGVGDGSSIWAYFSNDGYIHLWGGDGDTSVQSYSTNTWYRLQFKNINWTAKTYDFYVDGFLQVSGKPFDNPLASSMAQIWLWNDETGSNFYFDEFFVW